MIFFSHVPDRVTSEKNSWIIEPSGAAHSAGLDLEELEILNL